ncbi:hypothetical protein [Undibacterium sp. TJN19]|uniref:hypothetical protein n=1 Tax=Undibacterium sp. TJN19 TaxID=3413055 RepID=UPI003BF0A414
MKFKYAMPGLLLILMALTGCGTVYTFEGQKYDSKEKLFQASDNFISTSLNTVTPLPKPVSSKKLVFAIPSQLALYNESITRYETVQHTKAPGNVRDMLDGITTTNFRQIKVFYDAIAKKNIYQSTEFVGFDTMNGSYPASPDVDVIYYIEPAQGAGQWFFVSAKYGKQVFAYDRSSTTGAGKIQGFIDAVQVQAIKD